MKDPSFTLNLKKNRLQAELYKQADRHGRTHPLVLGISRKLDKVIVELQRLQEVLR